ncbi:MAG TPA: hypothetical protein VGK30_13315 [Candidatus Binatia bacterium]|jgi:hypothetical protein
MGDAPRAAPGSRRLELAVGTAGFIAYELGLNGYIYATNPSNDANFTPAFVAGPAVLSGLIAAAIVSPRVGGDPRAQKRAFRVLSAYLLLVAAFFVGSRRRSSLASSGSYLLRSCRSFSSATMA